MDCISGALRTVGAIAIGSIAAWACSGEKFSACKASDACDGSSAGGQGGSVAELTAVTSSTDGRGGSAASGGSGRSGGAAGEGGDPSVSSSGGSTTDGGAGAPPMPDCEDDSDCQDDSFCNGREVCNQGQCEAGEAHECVNPDEAHCSVGCVEGDATAECEVRPRDIDGDGFASVGCEAAPGDDCNDDDASIHPGVEEVCDGIDNDCNGLFDTGDLVPLSGTAATFGGAAGVDLAWFDAENTFLLVHAKPDGLNDVIVSTVSASGMVDDARVVEQPALTAVRPVAAPGHDAVRTAWPVSDSVFQTALTNPLGGITSYTYIDAVSIDMAPVATNSWAFAVETIDSECELHYWRDSVEFPSPRAVAGATQSCVSPRVLADDRTLRIAWQEGPGSDAAIWWTEIGYVVHPEIRQDEPEFALGERTFVAASGHSPAIAATSDGFAIAWRSAEGFGFTRLDPGGLETCRVDIEFGTGRYDPDDGIDLVDTPEGTIVFATDVKARQAELFRFNGECQQDAAATPIATSIAQPLSPALAYGSPGVAAAWVDNDQGYTRVFGPALCD